MVGIGADAHQHGAGQLIEFAFDAIRAGADPARVLVHIEQNLKDGFGSMGVDDFVRLINMETQSKLSATQTKQVLAELVPGLEGADKHYGAFVTLKHRGAVVLAGKMKERGMKVDARGDYLRLCPDLLNTRAELERAAATLRDLLAANTAR